MEWVETTGRTVEEAKEAALDQLGVDEQDAEFEIVEEPRFGLFGRLRTEARVRARVRPTKPRPKDDRRDRRGRRRTTAGDGTPVAGDDDTSSEAEPKAAPASAAPVSAAARRPATAAGGRASSRTAEAGSSGPASGPGSGGDGERPRSRTRARPSGAGAGGGRNGNDSADLDGNDDGGAPRAPRTRAGRSPDSDRSSHDETSPGGGMDVSLDEQGVVAREFLDGLVELMNLEAEVVTDQPEEETIELNLLGPDLGLLIGPKGATLLAIQDLTRTVVQRKTSAANGRILVDVAGYRRKRKDALARFTRQVAEEVQATGTRRVLEPMSAADRKIVHDTVNDIDGVITISEGEDPRRRVVILPVAADA